ncbi:pre-peptidase C-terminal domain-containing protein [Luteimonas sp. S4-F44]|uniref:PilC/PilY family type IV pilus protein n=1 Tax=Luteimonas sp. S4-F44 TaxID=2925842 RepID=UPI001F538038|nr:PilC/PilY family type IV pilus protein [Luteimonas sp. S4-F44]UNK43436.1 pre-peptidase C-terminal domain-containing protein [Luteimonas sp. S4-F44]
MSVSLPVHRRAATSQRRWWSGPTACLVTLLALPASAGITIPDDPLTTASRVAPNILFILDDSGSMAFETMPDNPPSTSTPDVSDYAYTRNSLAYDPARNYFTWRRADGSRMTGGTSFNAVYGSFNLVGGGTINLASGSSCRRYNRNNSNATTDEFSSGGTQVCGGVQTFYVPKDRSQTSAAYLGNGENYYRYQITADDVIRSEYGAAQSGSGNATGFPISNLSQSAGNWLRYSVTVPANTQTLRVTTSGGLFSGNADLYVRPGAAPTLTTFECRSSSLLTSNKECLISSPSAGATYEIGVYGGGFFGFSGITLNAQITTNNRCGTGTAARDWINCQSATPTGRSVAAEQANYATWFSYHRTRMKSAKAGASEAFNDLDSSVRVGFRTIWDRNSFDIPVTDGNDGRFVDNPSGQGTSATTSRSTWYDRMQNAIGYNGTPLHGALDSAGRYFSLADAKGPYGPQATSGQFSCRQNFAILTTDGYWNDTSTNYGTKVGNQDGVAGEKITGPNNQSYQYSPSAPYKDDYTNTLADVAMRYWKADLRTDLVNNVPNNSANPAFWQHMVTFGISIGLSGNKPWSSVAAVPSNATWEDPTDREDADRIDDLLHAAVNGRGAFVAASNPEEFSAGLQSALSVISARTSSYSNVTSNSVSLDTGSQIFNASYVSGTWSGAVTARAVTPAGVVNAVSWTSSITEDWANRKVFTVSGGAGANFPSTAQVTALGRQGGVSSFPVTGVDNANYLRGQRTLENNRGGVLRNRTSVLGDIVGSSPAYVADTNTLYVGANDGMLHAFDAATGQELFAYVPGIIDISALSTLSRPDYTHRYFVDGPVSVTSRALTPGKNLLIGTLGRGGKGVFALDVSAPRTATAASVYKWELRDTATGTDGNMGLVLGKPLLSKVAGNRVAAVLGNGVNSTRERAVLIVLDVETGEIIRQIDTGAGSTQAPNGLSAPVGVYSADGQTLAYVYAGDMLGNVWKFDLTSTNATQWSAKRLFTAQDANGTAQPITGAPTVATNPTTRKRWVFFGTGRYLTAEDADARNTAVQTLYGLIDDDPATPPTRANLKRRTITVQSTSVNGFDARAFEARTALPANAKGWYIDLPGSGERIVQDAQIVSSFLVTASVMPSGNACDAGGSGYINALDAFTGTSAGGSYFDLDGDGKTDDAAVSSSSGRLPVGSVNPGVGMPTLPNLLRGRLVVGGTGGPEVRTIDTSRPRWDRVSWRELRGD